ncbi:MAG: UDP-N-acetylglucosamine 2-epimerase (non-hydrolyzing) [Coriobacteriia bacterium]|nr:UDP-N-acetylglucosamine 2-epimerase (non-hydrolyzing) [Coriobacteriia bacterium]
MNIKILSVVGARPNFMKIAPFIHAIDRHNVREATIAGNEPGIEHILLHTGQHYDPEMSADFFETLEIPAPDINLGIGSGSHGEQLGKTMMAFEAVCQEAEPDWVVVVGDINATAACALIAKRLGIRVAHIESGPRNFDLLMPEEQNRIIADNMSDLLFALDPLSVQNLEAEGFTEKRIVLAGNIMIDTLDAQSRRAARLNLAASIKTAIIPGQQHPGLESIKEEHYGVVTLHRPSNVDEQDRLADIVCLFKDVATEMPLLWTVHPRTRARLRSFGLWESVLKNPNILLLEPLDYLVLLRLNQTARLMLTDSGGLQGECCVLGTPALILFETAALPETYIDAGGTNLLAGGNYEHMRACFKQVKDRPRRSYRPPYWDGHAAERMVRAIIEF